MADLSNDPGRLTRFMRRTAGMQVYTAERLIEDLELRIVLLPIDAPDPDPAGPDAGKADQAAGPDAGRWG